nr:immunoglobulin light chain junction region [Macaca mulatta]MOX90132.1 immunoglobulin light chain junction region [Macaca mulatta]MOX91288.1 immunoglobulin light chain junction region [Macaca mulatta]MPN90861.1 immunoglobulin light chain junction region [Macaca mulatta]MPN90910.1 immunoglobulin light chain junction region [Macaca mulatta]
CQHYYTTPYSF